ncbi:MAG: carboxypeptidase regulatory-like domain-containing protein [Methanoculleus sp.]|nr:carboxypeptidase regulatory-like domain-containing protein [Methanoculleus sp.]
MSGAWYNKTVFSESSGSAATIYIRDAQTGTLIPGANLVIEDAATEPPTELVNTPLPTGTGQFPLDQTNSLQYRASATADNYTLIFPILFGLSDEGATIVLWMSPDAAPDVPTEEGKSPLYGYAITQGSQQPIAGATVSLDGYGSTTTTSTGFYLFNNVTPGTYDISASAPLHTALTEPVTVDATATQHNLALKGHFLLTVTIKDSDTLANIQNATLSLSDGQESTQNPATFTADYGPYTITAAAGGYYPQIQSAYLDKPGTTTATVLLTAKPEPVPPPEMPNYPPHNVKFTVQTIFGTPIPSVNVTAQGIQQTPSSNLLERLLGINMTSTPINTELMSGTTDTNGEINFMMVEVVKYQITLYKPDVVNQTLEIYPKEDTYPIIISTAGGSLLPDAGDALRDIHINVTTSTEGDTGHIHIDYNDTTRKTTGLTIQVTQQNTTDSSAPEEVIASHTVANDANVTHTFDLSVYKGQSFFIRLEAEHPDFGTVHRDYAVAFKGVRVPLGPLPDGLYIYVAGFGLMLLGGIFGATSATRGVVVIAFAGWLFWGFGWLDDLGLIAPASLGLVSTIAVMGVIVTRYREEGYT